MALTAETWVEMQATLKVENWWCWSQEEPVPDSFNKYWAPTKCQDVRLALGEESTRIRHWPGPKGTQGRGGDGACIEISLIYTERKVRWDLRASFTLQLTYSFSHLGTVFCILDIKVNETDLYPLKLPSKYLIRVTQGVLQNTVPQVPSPDILILSLWKWHPRNLKFPF